MGGFTAIDFKDPENILIEKVNFDVTAHGYALCVVDTGGNHADLTNEYALVPKEMKEVAAFFGKEFLRDVDEQEFYGKISARCARRLATAPCCAPCTSLTTTAWPAQEAQALRAGDFDGFQGDGASPLAVPLSSGCKTSLPPSTPRSRACPWLWR